MNLIQFHNALSALPADLPLIFRAEDGDIKPGYHITEFKRADVSSIDCGGRTSSWTEASLQLLDGAGGDHMLAGKFNAILGRSLAAVPGLGDAEFSIEFAPANHGLRLYRADAPSSDGNAIVVAMTEGRAVCKPMLAAQSDNCCAPQVQAQGKEGSGSCCGSATIRAGCC